MDYYDYNLQLNTYDEYSDYYAFRPMEGESLDKVFHTCVTPSVLQFSRHVVTLIGGGVACRLAWKLNKHIFGDIEWIQHLVSVACGWAMLYMLHGFESFILFFLAILSYTLILTIKYRRQYKNLGTTTAAIVISANVLHEVLWRKPEAWERIRGTQMIATMKIISFAFDLEVEGGQNRRSNEPGLVPYLGYIFCPATCILGPWTPYSIYRSNILGSLGTTTFWKWLLWIFLNTAFAMIFLSISNCISFVSLPTTLQWLHLYIEALSVRCSHYLICFLSQATLSATAYSLNDSRSPNLAFGYMVTNPYRIEFPRSLSSAARSWNLPMHDWLKKYIFRIARNRFENYAIAIIVTYFVSSLLHGCDIRIYLVLLSLGCFSFVETALRAKLANIFDACITVYPCKKPCIYTNCYKQQTGNGWIIILVNLMFSFLAIFHLVYLGIIMHSQEEIGLENLETSKTLFKWHHLNYASHWIALGSYLFYFVI